MIVALVLWAYAFLLATVGMVALRRAAWVDRAPRLGIAAWQALSGSVVLAVIFGCLALVVPTSIVSTSISGLLEACAMALQAQYATPAHAVLAVGGLGLAAAMSTRWAYVSLVEFSRNAAVRRRHNDALTLLGRAEPSLDVTLLDDERPYVYCLAGRRHRIVMTTAASSALDEAQLSAVLAHERAHLRGRHHLVVTSAAALTRAFPRLPVFRHARDEITRLVELVADDRASRCADRLGLAEAMLTLAAAPPPAGALAARGSAAAGRVRRLIAGHRPLAIWARGIVAAAAVGAVIAPILVLSAPVMMAGPDCCNAERSATVAAARCSAMPDRGGCASTTSD